MVFYFIESSRSNAADLLDIIYLSKRAVLQPIIDDGLRLDRANAA
jgi:hypothetical protein